MKEKKEIIVLIVIIFMEIMISSCGKAGDEKENLGFVKENIIGTWESYEKVYMGDEIFYYTISINDIDDEYIYYDIKRTKTGSLGTVLDSEQNSDYSSYEFEKNSGDESIPVSAVSFYAEVGEPDRLDSDESPILTNEERIKVYIDIYNIYDTMDLYNRSYISVYYKKNGSQRGSSLIRKQGGDIGYGDSFPPYK